MSKLLPATYLGPNAPVFDFTALGNPVGDQLFNELVGSLASAFSLYANDPKRGRLAKLQADSVGFAQALAEAVETNYHWTAERGLTIQKVALIAVEYDEATKELLKTIQRADALSGGRGTSNLQASLAAGLEAAGEGEGGAANLLGVGLAGGTLGVGGLLSQAHPQPDIKTELEKAKDLLVSGLITQNDFDALKRKLLGL